jgi:hypothetical protein
MDKQGSKWEYDAMQYIALRFGARETISTNINIHIRRTNVLRNFLHLELQVITNEDCFLGNTIQHNSIQQTQYNNIASRDYCDRARRSNSYQLQLSTISCQCQLSTAAVYCQLSCQLSTRQRLQINWNNALFSIGINNLLRKYDRGCRHCGVHLEVTQIEVTNSTKH